MELNKEIIELLTIGRSQAQIALSSRTTNKVLDLRSNQVHLDTISRIDAVLTKIRTKATQANTPTLTSGEFAACRYRGYKNEPLLPDATDEMRAAWEIGKKARE